MSSLKIGVIGAGAFGKNHLRTLHEMGVLAGIAEPFAKPREAACQAYPGVPVFEDAADLFGSGVDAVTIVTPAHLHAPVAIQAIDAGLDVFIEKPMTLGSAEAEDLIVRAARRERILMVGHLLLFQPAIAFLKEFLEAGKLGKVFTLHQDRMKLGRARSVENVLWSFGVHDLAVLLHLTGQVPVKSTFIGHCGLQSTVADDTFLHLEFPNGTHAHLHNSWLWPDNRRGLHIIGEKGVLHYDEVAQQVSWHHKTINAALENVDDGSEVVFTAPPNFQPLRAELEHFLHCIQTRSTPLSDGHGGAAVVRILEQVSPVSA